ncbi:MAG: DNA primase [Candidatus Palauibacterales bacterium]|nr:DNA primase [Candidatus Palauibacterales bacterium]
MISDAVVEEVRARADLVDIVGEYTSLKRVGKSVRGPCPLHDGDDPNFSIDPNRQIFKCFVCGEGGDVFSFVMKHLGMDFPEAVRHVAKRVGVEVEEDDGDDRDPHAAVREALAFAAEWFTRNLVEGDGGEAGRRYLADRGLDLEEAESYGLGFAPDAWRRLRSAAGKHGFGDEVLMEAGLLSTSEKADEPYDRFRNRLIFAIHDTRDRPIGFGGRTLSRDDDVPKYINSPDSPVFHKGRTLYALNWARHAIRKEEAALIVEGFTDALSLHTRGRETAVAPLGTAMTPEQAETVARYADTAFLLYDSDAPGLRATFKAADNLLEAGVHPMVVTLPPDHDPDSLVREEGVEALDRCVNDAVDVIERKLQILEKKGYLESIEGRRRAVDGLLSTLRAAEDAALRDLYLDRVADRTGVRRATLVSEVARAEERRQRRERLQERRRERRESGREAGPGRPSGGGSGPGPRSHGSGSEREDVGDTGPVAERDLLLLLVRDDDGEILERSVESGLEPGHFENEHYRAVYRAFLETHGAGDDPLGRLEGSERRLLSRLRSSGTELTHPDQIFERCVARLKNRPRFRRLREIDHELEMADDDQAVELVQEKQEIARELRKEGVPLSFVHRWSESGPAAGSRGGRR